MYVSGTMMSYKGDAYLPWRQHGVGAREHELVREKRPGDACRSNLVALWAADTQFAYTDCMCSVVTSQGKARTSGLVGWVMDEVDLGLIRENWHHLKTESIFSESYVSLSFGVCKQNGH